MSLGKPTATALRLACMVLVFEGQCIQNLECSYFAFEIMLYYGPQARKFLLFSMNRPGGFLLAPGRPGYKSVGLCYSISSAQIIEYCKILLLP